MQSLIMLELCFVTHPVGRTDEWDEMIDVNVKGVLYGTNAVYKHFVDQGHGKIINISSSW